jgi:hypothetical protein
MRPLTRRSELTFSFSGYPGYAFIDRTGKYKPGAIQRISQISKQDLTNLLNME